MDDTLLPLSYEQRRLWLIDRLDPGSPAYNLPLPLRAEGPLDPAALAAALGEIARRHAVLRTTYSGGEGEPGQRVHPPGPFHLPLIDLSALPPGPRRRESQRLVGEDLLRPFDLEAGPVFRGSLVRLRDTEHLVLLGVHHIAFDGWSQEIFLGELAALYGAGAAGRPSPLPEPVWQYGDFAAWQQSRGAGEAFAAQLAYWRQALDGAPDVLEVPGDHPRPPQQGFRGGMVRATLPAGPTAALAALGRERGATLFMLMLAGFQALLQRWTGQDDFLVGTPVAGRDRAETQGLIGFFANTLALRADLTGDSGFADLLARVRETCLAAYSHKELPFELLVEELRPRRDPSRPPLVQVVLTTQTARREVPQPPGLRLLPLDTDFDVAKFDLTLRVAEADPVLALHLEYAADLFEAATLERMAGHLRRLLTGAAADPRARLSALPLLSAEEERQLLLQWSGTPPVAVADACLHELFEGQAARTPERTALIGPDGGRLSYRELDTRASLLARRLRVLGVGPEVLVAVMLERTADLIVALYAVLKAGGAYVPIDPAYPRQRVLLLLESSRAAVLLTRRALLAEFEQSLPAATAPLFLDPGWEEEPVLEMGVGAPPLPGNLAYIIYTSGSTGTPKGVAIEHRSAVALARWTPSVYSAAELSCVLGSTSICFDMSVFEIFCTLAWGGTLAVAENALALPRHPAAQEVTLIDTVPSAMAELVRAGEVPPSVRTVNLGGEALKGSLVAAIHERTAVEKVYNVYGPSEDTTFSTFALVPRGEAVPSIGRPLVGSRLYVLDAALRPVPAGVPGAVYLSGDGLSRGYLGRPDLTAERFIPDPYGPAGSRLYRVGDLARYRPDSELEFLGRIDHQVKVRGFRIELGEIEAALSHDPEVRECAVLALPELGGEGVRLVAFVVPSAPRADLAASLRAGLKTRLPEYMVPTAFAFLDALPLTPNGKLDRRALERIAPETAAAPAGEAPRTPLEQTLAGLLSRVLGVPAVGRDDDFFDLGGHSLMAVRLVAEIRQALGIDLVVRTVFDAPTVADLALALSAPRAESPAPAARAFTASRRAADRHPLSYSQRRLWFLDQLTPGSHVYNIAYPLRIEGPLAPAALAATLGEIVRRHEVLRTTYTPGEWDPGQVVRAPGPFPLPAADLSALPEERRRAEALRLADEEAARPFDLEAGPVFRATLTRLSPAEHHLLLGVHHIAFDGWSVDILLHELAALYEALAAGRPSPLPEPAWQYADFAAWQRSALTDEALAAELAFWRRALDGAPGSLELPADHPRPPQQSLRGRDLRRPLADATAAGLRALGRERRQTLFMVALAGFQALLGRYTGQEDLIVGSPVAGRTRPEVAGLIGFFVNTLALRADLAGDPSFDELLARVREACLAAYSHQDLPFETLVEELRPQRDPSRSPLVQVVLLVEALRHELPAPHGLRLTLLPFDNRSAKFDLTMGVGELEDGLVLNLEYATDLFEAATIERMAGHFETLLAGAVADPRARLSELPLLSAGEERQLLFDWSGTPPVAVADACLHGLFEAQAARTPERTALIGPDGGRLSYRELDTRASLLARRLRALGVGPETLVAVMLERTADLIVTLYAVLKAGGAYVPIDPAYPRQRVLLLLESSRAAVLLTRRALLAEFEQSLPAATSPLFLDPGWEEVSAPEVETAPPLPGNLAYIIYTSGSTGTPKGVAIEHRGAVALARWTPSVYSAAELSCVLGSTSICFDMSVFEIFCTLAWGGTLAVAENALALPRHPAAQEVTLIDTVPSAMAELVRAGEVPPSVRTVNLGGEALKGSLVAAIHERTAVEKVYNVYGPSEDTTFSTIALVPRGEGVPSIGRPLVGSRLYVLDAALRPVPAGVPGAVYLSGDGLSRGYLGRPDLTAERFIPDPYGPAGSRLYRVGDLARYRPDSELEFLGRIDHQVKVRGFRIELGEIEAVLSREPGVRECAVLALPEPGGEGVRLVAFVVPAAPRGDLAAGLRAALKARLPEYMVPTAFAFLDALPLTPNGKLDRRALERLAPETAAAPAATAAPRTPVEEVLAGIWAEVFGRPVGVHDNFFDLGGHSLLAVRAVSRIRTALEVEIPLSRLFAAPTVAGLAVTVEAERGSRRGVPLPPVEPVPRDGDLPLSFAQQRLWLLHRVEPGSAAFNVPYPLRLTGRLDPPALARALAEMARRHEALRTVFAERAGHPYQVVLPAVPPLLPPPLPVADLGALPAPRREEAALRAADAEARRPFDLARGPVLRAVLVRLAAEEHVLLVTLHHVATDGLSMAVFARELLALYTAFAAGRPSPLPEPRLQYADFAVWQRRHLEGAGVAALVDRFKERFGTELPVLRLPTDRPRPAVQTTAGAYRAASLPAELSAAARTLARRSGATLFMTLLAAFQALLARYAGQERIVVGSPVAGRDRAEIEGVIGFFVNTIVLPADLGGNPTFAEALARVRGTALAAYALQDLPFEKLVEALQPEYDRSRTPLFQVMFALQSEPVAPPSGDAAGGLAVELFPASIGAAQFDLTLYMIEQAGGGLEAVVEYNTGLFKAATIDRLLGHYQALLAAAVARPETRLSELPPAAAELPRPAAEAAVPVASQAPPDADARRDRLSSRLSKLTAAQREALEKRLRGDVA